MSHNPNTVKSQDDTTEDELGRTMTLLRAIEQLEKTECELEKVEKQLDIAVKCLKTAVDLACPYFKVKTAKADSFHQLKNIQKKCGIALQQIEELNK